MLPPGEWQTQQSLPCHNIITGYVKGNTKTVARHKHHLLLHVAASL